MSMRMTSAGRSRQPVRSPPRGEAAGRGAEITEERSHTEKRRNGGRTEDATLTTCVSGASTSGASTIGQRGGPALRAAGIEENADHKHALDLQRACDRRSP